MAGKSKILKPTFTTFNYPLHTALNVVIYGIRQRQFQAPTDGICGLGHPEQSILADDGGWWLVTTGPPPLSYSPPVMFPVRGLGPVALLLSRAITEHCSSAGLCCQALFHFYKFCLCKCLPRTRKIFETNPLRAESESWTLPMGAYAEWRALFRPGGLGGWER